MLWLFPEPLSPTIPNVCPLAKENDKSRTASRRPSGVSKCTPKCLTSSMEAELGSAISGLSDRAHRANHHPES